MGVIARQSVRGTIWTYLGVGVGVVTTFFVLTRFLTAEEIGLARVLIDAATLFIGLAQLGTSSSIIRYFPYFSDRSAGGEGSTQADSSRQTSDPYHGFFFWTIVIPFAGFCIFACIYLACKVPIEAYFSEKSQLFVDYYYMVLPIAFFMLYQMVFETSSTVLMRTVFPRSVVREFLVRVMLLVLYLLYAFDVLSLDGFVVGVCVMYAVAALLNICYLVLTEHVSFRPELSYPSRELRVSYYRYTTLLVVSAAASVFAPLLSSFMVSAKMGLDYTGIYTIAFNMAVMVSIPSRSMSAVVQPQIAQAMKENDMQQAGRLLRQVSVSLMLVGACIMLAIWLNIDLIFYILPNGATYAVARDIVFILCLTQLIITSLNIVIPTISYSQYYYFTLVFSFLLTISIIVLNNILIPTMGLAGAALSPLLSHIIYYIGLLLVLRFAVGISPLSKSHGLIAVMMAVVLILNTLWIRYLTPMIDNIWFDTILRTCLLLGSFVAIAYRCRLAPDINNAIERYLTAKRSNI